MDEAERWLAKNDPEFHDYKKRRKSEYPYHTAWQSFSRQQQEIPISNLWDIRAKLNLTDEQAREIIESMK